MDIRLPFISPQQLFRALDDLHALADAARSLPEIENRLVGRVDALESRAGEILALGERIDGQANRLIDTVTQAEGRVGDLLAHADRLDSRIDEVLEQFGVVDRRVADTSAQIDELTRQAARLADALPTLEEALKVVDELAPTAAALAQTVEPLQGAAERLGRMVDRFPGGARRATHGDDTAGQS